MENHDSDTIIIVEGITDKEQLEKIIAEDVLIICTHGTFGVERFDELLETYDLDHKEVFIFVDEDEAGIELRKQLSYELPHAKHIYISEAYKEVAAAPADVLATTIVSHHIEVHPIFLQNKSR